MKVCDIIVCIKILQTWLFLLGENFAQMLARHFTWGYFSGFYSYFLHKGIKVLFSCGGNLRKDKSVKNAKITPMRECPHLQYTHFVNHRAKLWETNENKNQKNVNCCISWVRHSCNISYYCFGFVICPNIVFSTL